MSSSAFEKRFFGPIRNYLVRQLEKLRQAIIDRMSSGKMDKILQFALSAMSLLFKLLPDYRAKIKGFNGKIAIKSLDEGMHLTADFGRVGVLRHYGLKVRDKAAEDANVTLYFKDGAATADFLLSGNPDIIAGILDSKLSFIGNINYLYRFVYLARHIPVELGLPTP